MVVNSSPQVFLFLSQILGKKIIDPEGRAWGRVSDLVVTIGELYPPVTGVLFLPSGGQASSRFPWQKVKEVGDKLVVYPLTPQKQGEPIMNEGELLLKDSLLDKQIVDTHGAKILRVNDLHLLKVNYSLRLVHVDVGLRGLMRRVGLEKATDKFLQFFLDYQLSDHLIPWRYVQPLSSPDLLRLKITQTRLAQLHPADLADIIEDLDIHKRSEVFQSLDVETAAETLEETDPKIQVRLIENLNPARASDIIEEMSPSEAADLLGDLPKDKAEGILKEMEKEVAEDVKELLVHPEEKAGGLMTTSFLTLGPQATVQEALDLLRQQAETLDLIYYLYVTDEEGHLCGVTSLRGLLMANPQACLSDLMDSRVISVSLEEEKEEIAERFAKYGFKAIPVTDETNRIKGVIPFKNLLEVVAPQLGK
ncbi:MAG: CBS domain-containing protein [Deltaproteobacteria bacterium]|nr:CBS domain-containing protein [Deltaproteobacteria bacterium]